MSKEQKIENLVEETMNSLEGIHKVIPRPFFFARLQSRLLRAENNWWEKLSSFIAKPAIAGGIVTIILFLNTWVFLTRIHPKDPGSVMAGQTETLGSEEYGIAANDYYLNENQ